MALIEELTELGCNTQEGIGRLMNKPALYEKMVKKLPDSIEPLLPKVVEAFANGNKEDAIASTHTIKGVTGNLSVTPLYVAYTEIVNLLRSDKFDEAKSLYEKTAPVQEKILDVIKNNM